MRYGKPLHAPSKLQPTDSHMANVIALGYRATGFPCLCCVDKLNPDSDAGKQHEGGEALQQLVVAGGDAA